MDGNIMSREEFLAEVASIKERLEQLQCCEIVDLVETASLKAAYSAVRIIDVRNNPPKTWEKR